VERLDISENVLVGKYTMTVNTAAEQASCEIDISSITGDAEGTISINGVSMDYTKEMMASIADTNPDDNDFFRELSSTAEEAGCVATRKADGSGYIITSRDYGDDELVSLEISGDLGENQVAKNADTTLTVDASSAYSRKPDSNGEAQIEFEFAAIPTDGIITINGVELNMSDVVTAAANSGSTAEAAFFDELSKKAEEAGCTVLGSAGSKSYTLVSSKDISLEFSNEIVKEPNYGLSITEDDANKINYSIDGVGTDAEIDMGPEFKSTATVSVDGKRVQITDLSGFSMDFQLTDETNNGIKNGTGTGAVTIEVTDIGGMTLQVGANQYQEIEVRIPEISSDSMYLDTVDVAVAGGADKALVTLDEAISKLGDVRSAIGAYTNRLEYAVSSLSETQIDLTSALSTLMDTDMAEEMTEYTQQNVLEQAAISVLSQANDLPQQVLSLLQ
jgi:flagellin-like hook-associated protein FlgL